MSQLVRIRDRAADLFAAEIQRGVREVGGNNRGPDVAKYLRAVNLPVGNAWCAAMVVWAYDVVCSDEGVALILPRTGKCAYLIQRCRADWIRPDPVAGAIAIHLNDVNDPDTTGHCGIVYDHRRGGKVYTGEGNTDDGGGREGGEAAYHWRPDAYWNGGYIDAGFPIQTP